MALSLRTGLRLSNVLAFEWRWVFNGRIQVPREASKAGTPITVQVHPELAAVLKALRERQKGIGRYVLPALRDGGGASATRSPRWFRARFDKTLAALRAQDPTVPATLTIHDLRRTAASLALEAGASLEEVGEMLGHGSHAYVTQRYAHVADTNKGAAALRIAL